MKILANKYSLTLIYTHNTMGRSLGIDIGGAHLKACLLTTKNRPFIENVGIYYTPIWKKGDQLSNRQMVADLMFSSKKMRIS